MLNDDYNHRMVAIDPATGAIVWQYGITAKPGTPPACSTPPTDSTYSLLMALPPPTPRPAEGVPGDRFRWA